MVIRYQHSFRFFEKKKQLTKTHKKKISYLFSAVFEISGKKNHKNCVYSQLYINKMDGGVYLDGHETKKKKKKNIYIYISVATKE
jgi:hypothetical protein